GTPWWPSAFSRSSFPGPWNRYPICGYSPDPFAKKVSSTMRIGLVWNTFTRLADSSIRYERYVRGFRALGHEVITVAPGKTGEDFAEEVHRLPNPEALFCPDLWSGLRLDAVFLPTWLGMADLLAAIRPHVRHLISLADSDG